jgi:molybdate transport system substrate-binding protein
VAPTQVTVLAAASLRDVLTELAGRFEAEHPGVVIVPSFDASSTLRTQVEAGASADLFLSADTSNPQALADGGLTDGEPVPFTGNAVTLIVPAGNPAGIETWADLATHGVRVIAAGEDVPISRYADEAIATLAAHADAPPDFIQLVEAAVVSREDNVRAVLAKLELGEGDAGFVYATDARASTDVVEIPLPPEARIAATYAGVVLRDAPAGDSARDLLTWLTNDAAQAVFAEYGFVAPP